MEDDDDMRRVMELLSTNALALSDGRTVAPVLFVSRHYQTNDFLKNITIVLTATRALIYKRWERFCCVSCLEALSTHEMYFRYVMFACDIEASFHDNIFDKIISVFALVINYNIETLINAGVNFFPFSVDTFMVYFKSILKDSFYKKGGFQQFSEYTRCHEYLPFEHYMLDHDFSKAEKKIPFLKNWRIKLEEKNNKKMSYNPNLIKHSDVIENTQSERLAKIVLISTQINLPILPNPADLNVRQQAAWKEKALICRANSKALGGQKLDTVSKDQTFAEFVECRETMAEYSNGVTTASSSNHEIICTVSEGPYIAENEKCETASECLKHKMTAESRKREMTISSSKHEDLTTAASSRIEALMASSNYETADTGLIQKVAEAAFKPEAREQNPLESCRRPMTEESTEIVLQRFAILESDNQMNNAVEQKKRLEWCENIVRKVVKYNDLKFSDPVNANNEIKREADKLLTQLKSRIKSLIDII